jgi:cobalt/nickel transport system ATP-binding protein
MIRQAATGAAMPPVAVLFYAIRFSIPFSIPSDAAFKTSKRGTTMTNAIEIRELTFIYPNGTTVLKNISLAVPNGSRAVLLGGSDAGKTTLLQHLDGTLLPQHGSVRIMEETLTRKTRKRLRQKVGMVRQTFAHSPFTHSVWEYVTAPLIRQRLRKQDIMERAELSLGLVGMLPDRDRNLNHLNETEKKKVDIARALATGAEILALDEPVAGLDPQGQADMFSLLQALHLLGKTILVATHDVDFAASWGDRLFLFGKGKLLAAGTSSLTVDDSLMRQAGLRLPLIAQPFAGLPDLQIEKLPRTVHEAVRLLWRLKTGSASFSRSP